MITASARLEPDDPGKYHMGPLANSGDGRLLWDRLQDVAA